MHVKASTSILQTSLQKASYLLFYLVISNKFIFVIFWHRLPITSLQRSITSSLDLQFGLTSALKQQRSKVCLQHVRSWMPAGGGVDAGVCVSHENLSDFIISAWQPVRLCLPTVWKILQLCLWWGTDDEGWDSSKRTISHQLLITGWSFNCILAWQEALLANYVYFNAPMVLYWRHFVLTDLQKQLHLHTLVSNRTDRLQCRIKCTAEGKN